ncbi:MAG: proteasome subunit alpha [Deltaproteobacteria bacterium]|jgi:proteasome alpha subunit|nr:proteasome subunit alpha [Deltaproteobacteria bacterium]MBW2498089.1 proteasome subunit alpha [Deltaproteobacteria bacterium]
MSMPFYVSPEQVMADKAEFARKGIARGKSIVALEHQGGVLLMAENATSLSKIGEIYDRIAYAGVGKFSEFDQLRKVGVRFADTKGYAYSREDVRGKGLANAFSQVIGEVFTREMKPLEIEIIVAEVGDDRYEDHKENSLYRIKYDGFISDHSGFCAIGGNVEEVETVLKNEYREAMPAGDAARLGLRALSSGAERNTALDAESLEVCVLDRARSGRKFCRLSTDEVRGILES